MTAGSTDDQETGEVMPDQLYRRCPDCRESAPATACPTCAGEQYIPAGITLRDVERLAGKGHGRWRFRIGTLMVLVLIAAMASFVVTALWREAEAARRLAMERDRARMMAEEARAVAQQAQLAAQANAQAPAPAPAPSGPAK
jgi:hypothetical protein